MKKFKSLKEQKIYLINNKNIQGEKEIIKVLYERPYASIINPYKKFFYTQLDNSTHIYEKPTSINDYYKLATLDDLIANKLHYYIGVFERRVKGAFAYIISEKMNILGDNTATMYSDIFSNLDDRLEDFKLMGFNDYKYTYNRTINKLVEDSKETQIYRKKLLESVADITNN
ncbi:MAG: Abi family protein, partial [Acholeplasmataceae bacterium]